MIIARAFVRAAGRRGQLGAQLGDVFACGLDQRAELALRAPDELVGGLAQRSLDAALAEHARLFLRADVGDFGGELAEGVFETGVRGLQVPEAVSERRAVVFLDAATGPAWYVKGHRNPPVAGIAIRPDTSAQTAAGQAQGLIWGVRSPQTYPRNPPPRQNRR
ncbi:MAG TPA: hypothetical protein VKT99_04395 [Xanthobacteraceae bacterium]|nr:hypothetical protein [Xanthobacteraceae bacterium]